MVEIITDRMNSPVEYHCGFCGNYAIVGVPVRYPFMEVVKGPKPEIKNIEISKNIKSDHDDSGTSPMQVGESLKPKKEEKVMQPKCFREGCDKQAQAVGLCDLHFHDRFGITVAEYRENKLHRTEAAKSVAARLKREEKPMSKKESNPRPEDVGAVRPAPPPPPPKPAPLRVEVKQPAPPPVPEPKAPAPEPFEQNRMVSIPMEVYEKIVQLAEQEYRPVGMQIQYLVHKGMSNG